MNLYGIDFDPFHEKDVVRHVVTEIAAGRGGQIVTPNVDILRRARRDREARAHVESADVVVADGKPLIWASQLAGNPLPARVPGSDLIWSLSAAMAEQNRSVYLFGGAPGTAGRAEQAMRSRFPGLRIAGHLSPPFGFDAHPDQLEAACATVAAAAPDLVYVGFGFPKQERVIARLRALLPGTWFLGCGGAIGFVAGIHRRAPRWMQRTGLEWLHRLANEPARLARRYLLHDLPFALELLAVTAVGRLRRRRDAAPEHRSPSSPAGGSGQPLSRPGGQS
ncbi:glycosyltransferase [Micromonospora endophytica]|uniref:Glycosyltransferase n=1 Tax=Micromonospora endophytica TaxID=515350 RepID=A0A2W2CJI7_9ACTN|nr:glycosyltransferase [Micromonospora endophytica]RIW49980.1 glycosyltransferase [Micromonospora endophytica]